MDDPGAETADLDPADWDEFRALAHGALDGMIDHLRRCASGRSGRRAARGSRALRGPAAARRGLACAKRSTNSTASVKPYATGNRHPAFMGWVHGAGTPVGMVAEMLAAGLNANCGGRDHIADRGRASDRALDGRGVRLSRGFGGAVRHRHLDGEFSRPARRAQPRARRRRAPDSASTAARSSSPTPRRGRAWLRAAGDATRRARVRRVARDRLRRERGDAPRSARGRRSHADRDDGLAPFLVVGTAGTVDIGAIDPLDELATFCAAERLWFHVDGAFGAMLAFSPELRGRHSRRRARGFDRVRFPQMGACAL